MFTAIKGNRIVHIVMLMYIDQLEYCLCFRNNG